MPGHSLYLDVMRGMAALSIVVLHTWLYADAKKTDTFSDLAFHELRLGLICFFVLSGYLLYRAWLVKSPGMKHYFSRRFARILPAYYVSMIGAVIIMAIFAPARLPKTELLPLFLVFGQNFSQSTLATVNPPTWTLVIEMSFYLVLPLLGLLALSFKRRLAWQLLIPSSLIIFSLSLNLFFALSGGMPRLLVYSLPALFYYFAAGMLAAVASVYLHKYSGKVIYLLAGLFLIGINIYLHLQANIVLNSTVRDLPAALGFALIIFSLPQKESTASVIKPLAWLGLISYGVYLWHMPILIALSNTTLWRESLWPALLMVVPLSILFGALSWYLIERPFLTSPKDRRKSSSAPAKSVSSSGEQRPVKAH